MSDAGSVDVMSYNIHHGEGMDGEYNLRRTAGDIWAEDPDVIGIQELDWNFLADAERTHSRSEFDEQIELLSEWLDMEYEFGATLVFDPAPASNDEPRKYGIGILSTHEILRSEHLKLPKTGDGEPRGLLGVKLRIEGTPIWFYTTHLGLDGRDRQVQVETVLTEISQRDEPVVLGGDFNATPDSDALSPLLEGWTDVLYSVGERRNTFPSPYQGHSLEGGRRIDYLFCSAGVTPVDGGVVETISSDHVPIHATVRV